MLRSIVFASMFAASLAASAAGRASTQPSSPARLSPTHGLTCKKVPRGWASDCSTAGFSDITGSESICGDDSASLGGITQRVAVYDRFPTQRDARAVADIARGQLVCIQFDAAIHGETKWAYVVAIDAGWLKGCRGESLCGPAQSPARWRATGVAGTCAVVRGRYAPACVGGWVRGDAIDAYSMGLHGQFAE